MAQIEKSKSWFLRGKTNLLYLWNDVYEVGIMLVYPTTAEQFTQIIVASTGNKSHADGMPLPIDGALFVWDDTRRMAFIGLSPKACAPSELAHESFHAAHHILSRRGLNLTDDSEEAYAYFIGWLVKKAAPFVLKPHTRPTPPKPL